MKRNKQSKQTRPKRAPARTKRRRPAWQAVTAGVIALLFVLGMVIPVLFGRYFF